MYGVYQGQLSAHPLTLAFTMMHVFLAAIDRLSRRISGEEFSGCEWLQESQSNFVSAYSCDRDLGMALGRPPAIQDEWIAADVSPSRFWRSTHP